MQRQAFLPLVTYPDANTDAIAANAIQMAACLDAGLHALALNPDIPDVSSPLARFLTNLPDLIGKAEETSRKRGDHLLKKVTEEGKKAGVEVTTEALRYNASFLPEAAATLARYHDCVLCGWEASNMTSQMVAEAVIFGAGRPTILLPELSPVGSLQHVAVAWAAAGAAAPPPGAARPLRPRPGRPAAPPGPEERPGGEKGAAGRPPPGLRARASPAAAVNITAEDCPIATTLQERALELGAGLLVMGAFGHTRVRDFVLGGATQGVLDDLRLPVMLSH